MTVTNHLGRTHPSLDVHRVAHRAGALQPGVQRPLRIDRRLLGDRQVLAAGCLRGSRLQGTLGRFGTGRCLGLAALRVQPFLLGQTLLLPTLLFVTAALLLAATFQLLLALLLGFALPFGALEGQIGLLHLWWSFNPNGGGGDSTGFATGGSGSTGTGGGRLISWVCITWVATGASIVGVQLVSSRTNSPACKPSVISAAPAAPVHRRCVSTGAGGADKPSAIIAPAPQRQAPR